MPFEIACPSLARALAAREYTDPTPVQAAVVDPAHAGADLLVSAATGSGKTVAYGLSVGLSLIGEAEHLGAPGRPRALVIAPTRELALQVHRELGWLYAEAGARVLSCVGGMDPRREQRALAAGAHVVVGTPGRLRDHVERGQLDLSAVEAVVLDEADEMLDLGFRDDLVALLEATPAGRRTLLFSATLPAEIVRLAADYQRPDARRIDVASERKAHADIDYRAVRVLAHETEKTVVNLLRWFEARSAIVFCATREGVRRLHGALTERGFAVVALSGEMGQGERNDALEAMRAGRARVCVATDVAARGIDLPDLGLVVHADLPHDSETLLHRSGRTGRAGRKGTAVILVPANRRRRAESLIAGAGVEPAWSGAPQPEEIHRRDRERLLADPVLAEEPGEDDLDLARELAVRHTPEELAAALIRLYRAERPEPEEVTDPAFRSERRAGAVAPVDGVARPVASVWFRLSVGRRDQAETRRILAFLCRITGLPGREIGAIRIGERESFVSVAAGAVSAMTAAAARPNDENVRIEASDAPPAALVSRPSRPRAKERNRDGRPGREKPGKARAARPA